VEQELAAILGIRQVSQFIEYDQVIPDQVFCQLATSASPFDTPLSD
jgi:hypothetical protein